jgi:RNA polymerase sigma-70 factor, ECF subfamily
MQCFWVAGGAAVTGLVAINSRDRVANTGREVRAAQAAEPLPAQSDAEQRLLALASSGDSAAFRALTERHVRTVVSIARRMLHDDAEAEDVAQETFLRLWRSGAKLEIGPGGVRPWLRRVASNLCIDRIRNRGRVVTVDELPDVPDAPRQLSGIEQSEMQARVDAAIKSLPERQRLALTLFHFEGLSQIEIGQVMNISDEAVESLLSRARRQLKTALKPEWQAMLDDAAG